MGRKKVLQLSPEAAALIVACKANGIEMSVYEMTDDALTRKRVKFSPFVCRARKPGCKDDPLVTYGTTPEAAVHQTYQNVREWWPDSFADPSRSGYSTPTQ